MSSTLTSMDVTTAASAYLSSANLSGLPPNSTCEGNTTAKILFMKSLQSLQTGILVSYLVTMTVGLLGNSLVIYIIARNSQIRNKSVANYYIWNLAFADLFFVLTMPLFCYATFCDEWPFGTVMCKLSNVFVATNRYASMFTLVALSFDRYLASFYNMGHLRTVNAGVIVCCIIWVLCGTISIPYWMYSKVHGRQCITDFSTEFLTFWTFFQLAMALLIPLILICLSYIFLAIRLQVILNASSSKSASVQKPSRKMLRTILVVVIIFLVCQVPWHANEIIFLTTHLKYHAISCIPSIPELELSMYLNTISTILGFISSCCNPIVYGILNDNYRKQYTAVLCCCCYKSRPTTNGTRSSLRGSQPSPTSKFLSFCLRRRHLDSSATQLKLSSGSGEGNVYRPPVTEQIEMTEQSG